MSIMGARKRIRDTKAVAWRESVHLDPWGNLDLDSWCEANCQGRFAHEGATFLFESPKDGQVFRSIWS